MKTARQAARQASTGTIRHRGYQPKYVASDSPPTPPPNKGSAVSRPQNSSGGKGHTADRVVKQG